MKVKNAQLRRAIETAKTAGWKIEATKSSHVKFTSPAGRIVVASSTPSDKRGVLNAIAMLKRHGLQL